MAVVRYLLIAGLLFLASCSSGGGGMPASSVMPEPPAELQPLEQLTTIATFNQAVTLAAASRVASSLAEHRGRCHAITEIGMAAACLQTGPALSLMEVG